MFNLLEFENKKEYDLWLNDFNKQTANFMQSAKEYYLSKCENDIVRKIFNDWWSGKCIYINDYKIQYNEEDWESAYRWTMDAISNGLG